MDLDSTTSERIEELQILEGNVQSLLMQKQSTQIESNEVDNALSEVTNAKDEVYKILNGVMIKSSKDKIIKELEEKKKILDLRLNSILKQENLLDDKAEKLRKIINEEMSKQQKKSNKS